VETPTRAWHICGRYVTPSAGFRMRGDALQFEASGPLHVAAQNSNTPQAVSAPRLRATLAVLLWAPTYAIEVASDELDAGRFATLTHQADSEIHAGRWSDVTRSATDALGLWRGCGCRSTVP
jgi:hypothetical protein